MTCKKANRLLSALLDNELSVEEARLVRAHLEECVSCSEEAKAITSLKAKLSAVQPVAPDPELFSKIRRRVHHPALLRSERQRAVGLVALSACASALMAALVFANSESGPQTTVAGANAPRHSQEQASLERVPVAQVLTVKY